MICSKCQYQFCWICGMKYDVNHFDRSNVFGCQGLQQSEPNNRCKLIFFTIIDLILIPFNLLLYPVYVLMMAYINPFYIPIKFRWICFCKDVSLRFNNCCCSALLFMTFLPFVLSFGLIVGCFNLAIKIVPAYIWKIYKLFIMIFYWRCLCCLNRHIS